MVSLLLLVHLTSVRLNTTAGRNYPWFKLTANNFFLFTCQLRLFPTLSTPECCTIVFLLDLMWAKRRPSVVRRSREANAASAIDHCFLFLSRLIMYAGCDDDDDECYVFHKGLFLPGVSLTRKTPKMMMMMMTGARVDLCNKSGLLRNETRWTCIEREKRKKNNQIRLLITIILLRTYVNEITPCGY